MELDAAGILAAVAAAVFAAQGPSARTTVAVIVGTFGLAAAVVAAGVLPSGASIATFVAVAAGVALARPQWRLFPAFAAGVAAAAWVSVLCAQGLAWLPATIAPVAVLSVAVASKALRSAFVTDPMRDEALLLLASFALVLAVGPGVVNGWQSAVALTAEPMAGAEMPSSPWLALLVAASVLLGGVYSMWKRR